MDGLKLDKWRKDFTSGVQSLKLEFDSFFSDKNLEDFYTLRLDETSQNLCIDINSKEKLPKEIEKRLIDIFSETTPEDSV